MEFIGVVEKVVFKGERITKVLFNAGPYKRFVISCDNERFNVEEGKKYKVFLDFFVKKHYLDDGSKSYNQRIIAQELKEIN